MHLKGRVREWQKVEHTERENENELELELDRPAAGLLSKSLQQLGRARVRNSIQGSHRVTVTQVPLPAASQAH